jgi:hypothetical protein
MRVLVSVWSLEADSSRYRRLGPRGPHFVLPAHPAGLDFNSPSPDYDPNRCPSRPAPPLPAGLRLTP